MTCDIGRLKAYLDGALAPEEGAAMAEHVAGCTGCRAELAALQQRGMEVAEWLAVLDPQPHQVPDAAQALARFRTRVQPAPRSRWMTVKGRIEMTKQTLLASRWRPAIIGVVALAVLVTLFSVAPVRHAAAQFLGIFRVRKFAVIPIDPAQMERLQGMEDLADAGMLGEPTFLREPDEPQIVADAAEATALAGFHVRVPMILPEGATLREFTVETGPTVRFEVDRAMIEALLKAAGVQDVTLPPIETAAVEVDIPTMVLQEYRGGDIGLDIVQLPSPTVTLPPGVDPAVLGEALLRLLGVPGDDVRRLAQSIDWTSTLVIPLPADVADFREVGVDGVTGLLLEERPNAEHYRQHRRPSGMVLWQRDGIVYAVGGANIAPTELLRIADSLH